MKIKWTRPALIVIERGSLEEHVLANCKLQQSGPTVGSGSDSRQHGCDNGPNNNCGACHPRGHSGES
jgi:hypothetical protein